MKAATVADFDDLDDFVLGVPLRMPDVVWESARDAAFGFDEPLADIEIAADEQGPIDVFDLMAVDDGADEHQLLDPDSDISPDRDDDDD